MANNYRLLSQLIKYNSEEQRNWLKERFEADSEHDEGPMCSYTNEEKDKAFWIYTEESGDVERIADLVADYQTAFDLTEPWILEWADTCSKPRLEEFTGGAVAAFKGETKYFLPSALADEWIKSKQ
jgi:hypothetical protein